MTAMGRVSRVSPVHTAICCTRDEGGSASERDLIAAFVDKIAQLKPQLVTFNGSSFDLPVLRYRAMLHKVPANGTPKGAARR
jgi:uncharacterized protein YprB with RNaseH-like and TPR domain